MVIKERFQSQETAIASFNFEDIIGGKSYKTFYPMQTISGSAIVDYKLMPAAMYSNDIVSDQTTTGAFAGLATLQFDSRFNLPSEIEGTAVVTFNSGIRSSDGTNDGNYKVVAEVWRLNTAGTPAFMVSGSTPIYTMVDGAQQENLNAIELEIPRNIFKIGETLRLSIVPWGARTGGTGATKIGVGIDPKNRVNPDGTAPTILTTPTIMEFHVPFNSPLR